MSLAGEQHGFARIKTADALHSPLHEPQGNLNLPLTEMSWDLSRNVFTNPVDLAEKPATREEAAPGFSRILHDSGPDFASRV